MNRNDSILIAVNKGYIVTIEGTVVGPRGKPLKLGKDGTYLYFGIKVGTNCDRIRVHRFQAYMKFGDRVFADGVVVRHLNNNSHDNSWDNIDLGSQLENFLDRSEENRKLFHTKGANAVKTRITQKGADEIRQLRAAGVSVKDIRSKYNINRSTYYNVIKNLTYTGV